ncbi:SMP-30/gluconolactonase/LRE family protein [Thalassotalea sediminis]|uniref:SMP-30/gluconolactonase/LRE family protein n=1 Tax=Thalassotalea sediminis TaxID=1759089 RepID=UPI00257412A4|nr:SMP-30/gluconolactonase/LRE family protein [Thalassotalea sediminis]
MKYKQLLISNLIAISAFACNAASETTDWMTDNTFTQGVEGPAVDKNGNLYAVNYGKDGTIGKILAKDSAETYLTLTNGSIGNGIRFDKQGTMYIADYVNHNILKVAKNSKVVNVHAHNANMNQPNDIAITDNGILFASDPNWSEGTGNIWRINQDGTTTLLEENMGTTNGIEVSPDNRSLYVNESVQRNVWRYDLDKSGNISNKTLIHHFQDHGMDGMRTDRDGNLYIARYGAGQVAVLSPNGKLIKTIALKGKHPTNVAFGGENGKQVFVTMQKRGAIETFENDIAGRNY